MSSGDNWSAGGHLSHDKKVQGRGASAWWGAWRTMEAGDEVAESSCECNTGDDTYTSNRALTETMPCFCNVHLESACD